MGKSLIASHKITVALLAALAVSLATATFIEKYDSTRAAFVFIYHNPLFFILFLLAVVNLIASAVENKLLKSAKKGFLIVHAAFIIILIGALVSHLFGSNGNLRLRAGQTADHILLNDKRQTHRLPFQIELVKFTLKRYPGSDSPASYESQVRIHDHNKVTTRTISMNNPLDYRGYRFFQMSYDEDENGSALSVCKDSAGKNITYAGYGLLALGFAFCFASKNSRIRKLLAVIRNNHS
ncbi:MAG: cytochrome c biogenesis protein ResB [Dysgonamonadaceae bacterium]|jgi:hypothetical protein|nr:cytochrome c biogenesis protein ResB [Dysgonamonadaceae bacterium]